MRLQQWDRLFRQPGQEPAGAVSPASVAARQVVPESRRFGGRGGDLHDTAVYRQRQAFLPRGRFPELQRLVPAGGGDRLAVGREAHAPDAVAMTLQGPALVT